ncbi:hypothetical protein DYJ25_01795 [Prevotella denticola]|nr:hypothetical protein DYJ25_01795 [Prevotella denticola]
MVLKASHHGGTPPCLVRLFPTAWEQNSQVLGTVFPTLGTGSPDRCVSAYALLFRAAYILQCFPNIPKYNDKKTENRDRRQKGRLIISTKLGIAEYRIILYLCR